ncbi:MAG: hypothetical protein ACRD2Z_15750 [Thermoanaerobaculia bacterium]
MTVKTDGKKRVVLPGAQPGQVYDVEDQGGGRYLLVRLERPEPRRDLNREECLQAIDARPLRLEMSWEELARLTRQP